MKRPPPPPGAPTDDVRVAFDARWIAPAPSGIGIYARELLRRLPRLAPDWQFRVLFRSTELAERTLAAADLRGCPNVVATVLPYGVFAPLGQVRLPWSLRRWRCDLFHSPNYMLPFPAFPRGRPGRCRCVTTIHDVIPLVLPDHAPRSRTSRLGALFRCCLRESVARADAVLTVSETSRRDLVRTLRLGVAAAGRVRVVYNGVGAHFNAEGRPPLAAGTTQPRTLLYVGRLDPYKNVVLLIEAFAQARSRLACPLRLRIVGPPDPRYPEAGRRAGELGVRDAVEWAGFVADAQLAEAYRQADLLVHPSRYEGFGLQLVEAMRCGLPVVCTDGGAQPEIAGEAAVVAPANDAGALADAIVTTLADPRRLADLQRRGLARSRRFDWDRTAADVLAIYRERLTS